MLHSRAFHRIGGGLDRFKAKLKKKKKKGAYTFHSEKFTSVNAKLHFCSLTSVVSIGDIYLPKETAWIVQKRADSPPLFKFSSIYDGMLALNR